MGNYVSSVIALVILSLLVGAWRLRKKLARPGPPHTLAAAPGAALVGFIVVWSLPGVIVVAVLSLLAFPFGTALGAYSL
jgi:hypothetical protein